MNENFAKLLLFSDFLRRNKRILKLLALKALQSGSSSDTLFVTSDDSKFVTANNENFVVEG